MIKELLKESYDYVESNYGLNVVKDFPQILSSEEAYNDYILRLAEGLEGETREQFLTLASTLRESLLKENLLTNYTPYQTLLFPLLRIFFPRLVAREAVTVKPMDKPEHVFAIFKAIVRTPAGTVHNIPEVNTPVSNLPMSVTITFPGTTPNEVSLTGASSLIAPATTGLPASLSPYIAGIERYVKISGFSNGTVTLPDEVIVNTNDGTFRITLDFGSGPVEVHGHVDFQTGDFYIYSHSATEPVSCVVTYTINMEYNDQIQPEVELTIDTIRLIAKRRSLRVKWSPEFEQDLKALFDVDVQAEIVNIMGQQIAIDIDQEIINDLLFYANAYQRNQLSFSKYPPATFAYGHKQWYENFITVLNTASAKIYTDTNIGPGNVVLMNPFDAQIVQSLDVYAVEGYYTGDMNVNIQGLQVGTLNGQYRILTSTVVPQGKAIVLHKPQDERAAVYVYAPYVPLQLINLPMGNLYNLTAMTRYAKAMIRPQGVYVIDIKNDTSGADVTP